MMTYRHYHRRVYFMCMLCLFRIITRRRERNANVGARPAMRKNSFTLAACDSRDRSRRHLMQIMRLFNARALIAMYFIIRI